MNTIQQDAPAVFAPLRGVAPSERNTAMREHSTPEIPYGYCHCGCGQKTTISVKTRTRLGHVKGEPVRLIRGHGKRSTPFPTSLYVEQDCGYVTPCWVWQLSKGTGGYGQYKVSGKLRGAHRWMYEQLVGPVPDGLYIDHLCRNRVCVNPDHMEPVTNRENVLRGVSPPAVHAQKTHCIHGHEFTVENTRIGSNGGRWCRSCSKQSKQRHLSRKEA